MQMPSYKRVFSKPYDDVVQGPCDIIWRRTNFGHSVVVLGTFKSIKIPSLQDRDTTLFECEVDYELYSSITGSDKQPIEIWVPDRIGLRIGSEKFWAPKLSLDLVTKHNMPLTEDFRRQLRIGLKDPRQMVLEAMPMVGKVSRDHSRWSMVEIPGSRHEMYDTRHGYLRISEMMAAFPCQWSMCYYVTRSTTRIAAADSLLPFTYGRAIRLEDGDYVPILEGILAMRE